MMKRKAFIDKELCCSCGNCIKQCPVDAISIFYGQYAISDHDKCVGCQMCAKQCPANAIEIKEVNVHE